MKNCLEIKPVNAVNISKSEPNFSLISPNHHPHCSSPADIEDSASQIAESNFRMLSPKSPYRFPLMPLEAIKESPYEDFLNIIRGKKIIHKSHFSPRLILDAKQKVIRRKRKLTANLSPYAVTLISPSYISQIMPGSTSIKLKNSIKRKT